MFELVQVEAHGGDKDKGLECYGIGLYIITTVAIGDVVLLLYFLSVYPENCYSYHGPHSIDCLITIWEEVDCKVKGYRYPSNLTTSDADALKFMNLT